MSLDVEIILVCNTCGDEEYIDRCWIGDLSYEMRRGHDVLPDDKAALGWRRAEDDDGDLCPSCVATSIPVGMLDEDGDPVEVPVGIEAEQWREAMSRAS